MAHGTPLGTLIWNAKDTPTSEQVAEWNQRWQESEQFERDALAFNYAVIEDNRTIGNRLVMEQGAKLKERGLLDPDELEFQGKLEAFWNKYPNADSGLVRGSKIEPIYHKKSEKFVSGGEIAKGLGHPMLTDSLRSLAGCAQRVKRQGHFEAR